MKNKGSIYAGILIFYILLFIFFVLFGTAVFQIVITAELHNIKNDMYLINRNVLMSLQRDVMGEDSNAFYEKDVKKLIEDEIKRQWNADVSRVTEKGFIYKVEVNNAKIVNTDDKMYIESLLDIELRPIVFQSMLNGKLKFMASEKVKVEKMKGWSYEKEE